MADSGTKVYKKTTLNGKVTTYLGNRDYVDHLTHTDPIYGVVLVDPEYVENKKVFVKLICAFRYGREDLDVLGLTFRKDFCSVVVQVYPSNEEKVAKTALQQKLFDKLGENAYPFMIEIPKDSPCSVTLQPALNEQGKACGVDYQMTTYVAEGDDEEKMTKESAVKLAIRKVQFEPDMKGPQPCAEVEKKFLMSDKPLLLEASLDKDLYYHGETISVNVVVTNNSTKTVKKVRVEAHQLADICLYSKSQYKCQVAELEENDQVAPSANFCKVYQICPQLKDNKEKRGLALDGQLKHEDTNLASSTIVKEGMDKDSLGIIVQYQVKVRLLMKGLSSEVSLDLPLRLMHPRPEGEASGQTGSGAKEGTNVVVEEFARERSQES